MNTTIKKENPLGSLPINKLMKQFTIPAIIAMLVTSIYNIIDQIFIGKGISTDANAATTVAFPVMLIVLSVALLLGVGVGIFISMKFGEKDIETAKVAFHTIFLAALSFSLIFTTIAILNIEKLVIFFGAKPSILNWSINYTSIILIGSVFNMCAIIFDKVIRADGAPIYSMICLVSGAVLNIILDPIAIFVLDWGVSGAAIATVFSQLCTFTMMIIFIQRKSSLKLRLSYFKKVSFKILTKVSFFGLSAFILQIGAILVQTILNRQLVIYGDLDPNIGGVVALSAMGVIMKFYFIIISICVGIGVGIQPILSFNYGAKNYARVKETFRKGFIFASLVTIVGWLLVELFPEFIIGVFTSQRGQFFNFGIYAIRVFLGCALLVGGQIITSSYFQSVGKPLASAFLAVLRQVLVSVPGIIIMPIFFGIKGIIATGPISELISGFVAFSWIFIEMKNLNKKINQKEVEHEKG